MDKPERYSAEWQNLPSVTEVLEIFTEKKLLDWFKRTPYSVITETSKRTSDIGTIANDFIDLYEIDKNANIKVESSLTPFVVSSVKRYLEWRKEKTWTFIKSQVQVINKEFGYIGTIDRLEKSENGGLILTDWKTSKQFRFSNLLQITAYKKAYESMHGEKIEECYLIRLDKNDTVFNPEKDILKVEDTDLKLFSSFINLLNFYRVYKETEETDAIPT